VKNRLIESDIPQIMETEEEKQLSDRDLKNRNFTWALQNLRGKAFVNKSIKTGIHISRDGLGEWKTVLKHSAPYPEGSGTRCYCTVFGYRLLLISHKSQNLSREHNASRKIKL